MTVQIPTLDPRIFNVPNTEMFGKTYLGGYSDKERCSLAHAITDSMGFMSKKLSSKDAGCDMSFECDRKFFHVRAAYNLPDDEVYIILREGRDDRGDAIAIVYKKHGVLDDNTIRELIVVLIHSVGFNTIALPQFGLEEIPK